MVLLHTSQHCLTLMCVEMAGDDLIECANAMDGSRPTPTDDAPAPAVAGDVAGVYGANENGSAHAGANVNAGEEQEAHGDVHVNGDVDARVHDLEGEEDGQMSDDDDDDDVGALDFVAGKGTTGVVVATGVVDTETTAVDVSGSATGSTGNAT